jgi:transmembrane 9 superfamily member 1
VDPARSLARSLTRPAPAPAPPRPPPHPQDRLSTAIEEEWYGELYVDDLPMWIYVGESESEDFLLGHTENSKHYLYTHLHFIIGVNGDRIVTANVSASPYKKDITTHDPSHEVMPHLGESHGHGGSHGAHGGGGPITVDFTYSVQWVKSDVPYEGRMEVYAQNSFMPATLEIHWLSIINSLVLVMLLTAFLAIILMRVIKNDFTRYMRADDEEEAGDEETGWKLIHGDVFRLPPYLSVFSAFVGAGAHLFAVTLVLLSLSVAGTFSLARRGSIVAACIILYVLTAFIGGYESARLYKSLKGSNWVWNVMLNLVVFPAPVTATFAVLNTTAIVKASTAALPFGTIAVVVALFLFVAFPLTVLGGIAGHNSKEFEPPCRTSKVPRQIPEVPFYRSAPAQMFMAGFLPFSAISIELHYIFASVWGHKVYTLYGILFLAFLLLTIVTSFIVIALTYFQLAAGA